MANLQALPTVDEVIEFWFGELDDEGLAAPETRARWFKKDLAFDQDVVERFGSLIEALTAGEGEGWLETARGALAYVIVLDQLTRNAYRGTGRMYTADARALGATFGAIEGGLDRALPTAHRVFLYMPLMHCEGESAQHRCVEVFEALAAELSGRGKERAEANLGYAERHRDIVVRFGRFPHRNELLDRESTPEETAFLEEPGSRF
ncbi:MAG: DUF924 domain-containing protein [Deltaproteobacteria bacterium]|nr:DUF924 domain-containing protein [Deltaproteobacteria bacterium]